MKFKGKWIVVADSSRARIFAADQEAPDRITEIGDFAHPQARAGDSEISSYDPGRALGQGAGPGPRSAPQQKSAKDHSTELFSKQVAAYLEQARVERRYERLCLVAAPEFLGLLRKDLSRSAQELVSEEIAKDVSWFEARDIEAYLKKL